MKRSAIPHESVIGIESESVDAPAHVMGGELGVLWLCTCSVVAAKPFRTIALLTTLYRVPGAANPVRRVAQHAAIGIGCEPGAPTSQGWRTHRLRPAGQS